MHRFSANVSECAKIAKSGNAAMLIGPNYIATVNTGIYVYNE